MRPKVHICVLVLYAILTLLMTFPLILNLSTKIIGGNDAWQSLWGLWWFKKSVEDNASIYYTNYLFYPTGVNLAFHMQSFFNLLLGIPLQDFFGLIATYNILILLSFVIGAYGTFLLVEHLTKNKTAAFISGVIFAFCPYHFSEIFVGHLNLVTIQWIPFAVLYVLKTYHENGFRNPVLASFFIFMVAISDWQYLGLLFIFILFFLSYHFYNEKNSFNTKLTKRFLVVFVLSLLFVFPLVYPMLKEGTDYSSTGLDAAVYYSADFFSFFIPLEKHPLLGGYGTTLKNFITSDVADGVVVPAGYVVLILACLYMRGSKSAEWFSGKYKRTKELLQKRTSAVPITTTILLCLVVIHIVFKNDFFAYPIVLAAGMTLVTLLYAFKDRAFDFWSASAILFAILALGPVLHFLGEIYFPLPCLIFYLVPGFSIFRAPYRFDVFLMLSLAVISGFAIKKLSKKIALVVLAVVLFEFMVAPISLTPTTVPAFYHEIANDTGDYAILDVPIAPRIYTYNGALMFYGIPEYEYLQTVHHKKMVGGYTSRIPPAAMDFLENETLFYRLRNPEKIDLNASTSLTPLKKYNIQWVIIHKDIYRVGISLGAFDRNDFEKTKKFIKNIFRNETPYYEDDSIIVYRVK